MAGGASTKKCHSIHTTGLDRPETDDGRFHSNNSSIIQCTCFNLLDGSVNLLTDSNDSTCQFHFVIHKLHSNMHKMCELKVTFLAIIYFGTAFLSEFGWLWCK